jgi:glycosyltransferase involved in cell wall biosynthesis
MAQDSPLHVMVANNIYPPIMAGGAELIVAYLCEGLAARGHRVTVVSTCGPEQEPYPTEMRNGVEVIRFFPPNLYWSFDRSRAPGVRKWLWHARDAWNVEAGRRLRSIIDHAKPDILHTHLIDGMSASIWGNARRRGIPVLHTAHDYHLLCPRAFMMTSDWKLCTDPGLPCRMYRNWHLATSRYVDLFVSPSRFLLDMHRQAGLRARASAVVGNGIPQPEEVEEVRQQRVPESRLRFLMMTRLTVEKGVGVVIEALARLPRDLPIEIAIAGTGPLEDQVRAAAAKDGRLSYLGYIAGAAKRAAFTRAGHLLFPSLWYENAPVAIAEAAAYGLGVIGSDIGGIPEFIEDGRTGILFPPGDADALAHAILRVVQTADALPELAARSRAVAARFTADRMIDDYEWHYRALCRSEPAFAVAV